MSELGLDFLIGHGAGIASPPFSSELWPNRFQEMEARMQKDIIEQMYAGYKPRVDKPRINRRKLLLLCGG